MLTDDEWDQLKHIKNILEPFAGKTTKVQDPNVSLSEFFGYWLSLKVKMRNHFRNDDFAKKLLEQMKLHEADLFQNPVVFGAIYLDPRYQVVLPSEIGSKAIDFLTQIYSQMKEIGRSEESLPSESNTITKSSSLADLYSFLDELDGGNNFSQECTQEQVVSPIVDQLKNFNNVKLNIGEKTVMDYWLQQKDDSPELFSLAAIIHEIMTTQTTVERAFSALNLILGPLRTRMSFELLESILLIRLNQSVYETVSNKYTT